MSLVLICNLGFLIVLGGYLFGQVWKDPANPDFEGPNGTGIVFPEGTVSFKLLFTQATPEECPFLKNIPAWEVMTAMYPGSSADPDPPRVLSTVRLLQIDVAVKDGRFGSPTGWNFASFLTSDDVKDQNPWRKLIPIGTILYTLY